MSKLPTDWSVVNLRSAAEPSPDSFIDGDWIEAPYITTQGIRLIQTGNIGISKFLDKQETHKYISRASFRLLNCKWVNAGDLLICRLADPIGRACEVPADIDRAITSVDCTIFRVATSRFDKRFVLHWLNSHKNLKCASDNAAGSTRSRISRSNLGKLPIPQPHLDEQRLIAQTLDTLDTAIHQTEAIIAKLKAVKQGLLHDLLTRGIDANGVLRPPQSEAPHLYKESPLGWIPKEWHVVRVGEDADIEHGFAFPGHQFTDKEVGPALLVPGNFHREGGLYFTVENTKYFSGKYPQQYVLSDGDVLIVMTDLSPMTLILGRTVVLAEEFKVLHNQRIGKFRFKKDGIWDATFFAEALSQDVVRLKVIAEATGTTVRHTSPDRIKNCHVARPGLQEQQLSAQRIAVVDARKKSEADYLLKLKQTKTGLMDDLLTGRVRVTPLLDEAAQQGDA